MTTRPSPEPGTLGHYVYGVVQADARPSLDIPAVDERFQAQVFEERGLGAVVSAVPLAEFGEESLAESLADPAWLEQKIRAHETVLEHVLAAGDVVPFRFATVYVSESRVREMLRRDRETLAAALERIRGKHEWGVKGFARADQLSEWLRETRPELAEPEADGSGSEGSAYLARKRLSRLVETEAEHAMAAVARECHTQLAAFAAETRLDSLSQVSAERNRGALFLNAAYLVERSREQDWCDAAGDLTRRFAERGVRVEPTGPWPAYNFVGEETR